MGKFYYHKFSYASGYTVLHLFSATKIDILRSQDLNNFESDPEEFARTFCKDLGIDDPEVGVSLLTWTFPVFVVCFSLSPADNIE